RAHRTGRARRDRPAGPGPQRGLRLPELLELPAPDGSRERRLRAAQPWSPGGGAAAAPGQAYGDYRSDRPRRPVLQPAFGRPAAACGAGPRAGIPARSAPARRAIWSPRREDPRPAPGEPEGDSETAGHHDDPRHA